VQKNIHIINKKQIIAKKTNKTTHPKTQTIRARDKLCYEVVIFKIKIF
jgi:hypothetical protein